jgi:hypothetical protein
MFGSLPDISSEANNILNSFERTGQNIAQRKAQEDALRARQEQFRAQQEQFGQNLLQKQSEQAQRNAYNQELLKLRAQEIKAKGNEGYKYTGVSGQTRQKQIAQQEATRGLMTQAEADEIAGNVDKYTSRMGMYGMPPVSKLGQSLQMAKQNLKNLENDPNATPERIEDAKRQVNLTDTALITQVGGKPALQQINNLRNMQSQLHNLSSNVDKNGVPLLEKALEKYSGVSGELRFWGDKLMQPDDPDEAAIYNAYQIFKDSRLNMILEEFRKAQGTSVEMKYIVNMLKPIFDPTAKKIGETPELAKLRWKAGVDAMDEMAEYYTAIGRGELPAGSPYKPSKKLADDAKKYNDGIAKNIEKLSPLEKIEYKAQKLNTGLNDIASIPINSASNFLGSLKGSSTVNGPAVPPAYQEAQPLPDDMANMGGFPDEQ